MRLLLTLVLLGTGAQALAEDCVAELGGVLDGNVTPVAPANINIDGLNVDGRTTDLVVVGMGASELEDYAQAAATDSSMFRTTFDGATFAATASFDLLSRAHALATTWGKPVRVGTVLTSDTFSALHRLRGDEIFHFYLGDPVEMLHLAPDGTGGVGTVIG